MEAAELIHLSPIKIKIEFTDTRIRQLLEPFFTTNKTKPYLTPISELIFLQIREHHVSKVKDLHFLIIDKLLRNNLIAIAQDFQRTYYNDRILLRKLQTL